MAPRFGTDGVRGLANEELTAQVALALGRAAPDVIGADRFVVGRDPRRSGPMLEAALVAGLCSAGVDVELLGVVPTPAVAWAAAPPAEIGGTAGAMISASHNPYADNGIKLFAPGGLKLADDVEAAIEDRYRKLLIDGVGPGPTGPDVGTATPPPVDPAEGPAAGWADAVVSSIEPGGLADLRIVLDCANGAASTLAPGIYRTLGADVTVIGDRPDGVNINDGFGSTAPEALAAAVTEAGAHIGLAFDGDADRLIAVDETGAIVDGDRVIAMLATDWAARGRLAGHAVVVTVMTNLGFHLAMREAGIEVVSTAVGDRYVLQALDDGGLSLGGEQSGHVICRELATTGDGALTGVQLADALVRADRPLSALATESMTAVPQVLRNVRLPARDDTVVERLADDVRQAEETLGEEGRVVLRASGTEPLVRIMVEHVDSATAERICEHLVSTAERLLASDH